MHIGYIEDFFFIDAYLFVRNIFSFLDENSLNKRMTHVLFCFVFLCLFAVLVVLLVDVFLLDVFSCIISTNIFSVILKIIEHACRKEHNRYEYNDRYSRFNMSNLYE
jgi:hypothetical protein